MYRVKYSRWASLIALSERSGCSHSGSFCSERCNRSLNVQPNRARYHARYRGTSRSNIRTGAGTGVRKCSNGAAQCAERWKIVSDATRSWTSGPNCIALAPLPITATCLAGEVEVARPRGGVWSWTGEAVEARDVRVLQRVEDPGRTDHGVRTAMLDGAVGQGERDVPALVIGVVLQPLDLRAEADVASQVEAVGDVLEVRVQLVAQREVHRPVVRSERERVQVVRRVHARTGVAVLPPRAADGRVLLDHGERDAGALEVDRGADPRHARADDEHLEPVGHVDRLDIRLVVQADLGADHLAVLVGDRLAHRHAEHVHEHRR